MQRLRLSIIALAVVMTVFYNIERLDFQQANLIDVPSYVYVLEFAIVICILTIPLLSRVPLALSLISGALIYIASHTLFIVDGRPMLGGIYTYIFISEVVLLLISIFIAYTIARSLHEFEDAVENVTFADVKRRVRRQSEMREDIKTEMSRSRRYGHTMSVVVIEPNQGSIQLALHRMVHEVQQAMMSRYIFLGLARIIRGTVRRMDIVMEQDDHGRLIILCPETDPEGATRLIDRIRTLALEKLGLSLKHSIISFPNEALTFDDLVHQATERLHDQPDTVPHVLPDDHAQPSGDHKMNNGAPVPEDYNESTTNLPHNHSMVVTDRQQ